MSQLWAILDWLRPVSHLLTMAVALLPFFRRERRKQNADVQGGRKTSTADAGVQQDVVVIGTSVAAGRDIKITDVVVGGSRPRREQPARGTIGAGPKPGGFGPDSAAKDRHKNVKHYHDKGQIDRGHSEWYSPPDSSWPSQFEGPHEQAERDVYNAGRENVNEQDDRSGSERTISIWIVERSEDSSKPLHLNVTYTLNFKVGAPVPGSLVSGPETEVPSADVPSGGLRTEWLITSSTVELASGTPDTGVETSEGLTIWTARIPLLIPQKGESAAPQLRITPRASRDAHLDVVIFAGREVYRQFRVDLAVEEVAEASPAGGVVSLRDEVVHAPAEQLNLKSAREWMSPPGTLTIWVGNRMAVAHGEAGPKPIGRSTQWHGVQARVAGPIKNTRSAAERFRARWEGYLNDIGSDDLANRLVGWSPEYDWGALGDNADLDHRRRWDEVRTSQELHDLAYDGHSLYEAFFPPDSDLRSWMDALAFGQRLNIYWLPTEDPGWVPHVPWGLMYLPDVPGQGEPVDPMGFLALRLRLGYTAHAVQAPSKGLGGLNETYGAHFLYWGDNPQDLTGVEARWQKQLWANLKNQVFIPAAPGPNAKAELVKLLNEPAPPPVSVLYLFCQCNVGDGNDPVLRFGGTSQASDVLRRTELSTRLLANRPLVFANACTTAAGDPYFANELEQIFFRRGCRAYLGTQTKVPVSFASRFALVFFHFFYRRADPAPIPAGEAAAQARLFLWTQYRNIGGLFYTYVNLYELYMASDAEVARLRT